MDVKSALKAHMSKGMKAAHPDSSVKKMKKGGIASTDAMKYGRNLARAMNQQGKLK